MKCADCHQDFNVLNRAVEDDRLICNECRRKDESRFRYGKNGLEHIKNEKERE